LKPQTFEHSYLFLEDEAGLLVVLDDLLDLEGRLGFEEGGLEGVLLLHLDVGSGVGHELWLLYYYLRNHLFEQ
jgi:hypothetical protein